MKIGTGHLMGMLRKGLTELGQYLPAFNQAGTQITEDAAIWPNQTQGEIAESRGSLTLADLRSYSEERARESYRGMDRGQSDERGGPER